MAPKPPLPPPVRPVAPARQLAPHLQVALSAVQAKWTGASPSVRQVAPHVQSALTAAQPKAAGAGSGMPPGRPQAPHVQAALGAVQRKPGGGCCGREPIKPVRAKEPCCSDCSDVDRPAARSALSGQGAIQRATRATGSGGGGAKKEKKAWAPSDKKAKKLASSQRHQVKVAEEKAKAVASCEEGVGFAATFNTHLMSGEGSGTSHTGYHSQNQTDFAAFGAGAITGEADANGVYVASCTKTGKTAAKASTFFPDGWDIARIRREVAHAYCHPVDLGAIPGRHLVSWCGNAETAGILIGGRGPKNAIETAFPAYEGSFAW